MFARRASVLTAALGILATAATAPAADTESKMVEFRGGSGQIKGYLARPKGEGPFPGIIVVHEWWGLSDWIKQDCDKLAGQGYAALAVDLYRGEVTTDPAKAHELMRALNQSEAVADLKAGAAYLASQPFVARSEKLGVIGWCMGGGLAREFSQASDQVGPTVICYGSVTSDPNQVEKFKGKPVLGIFGREDRGIKPADVEQFSSALSKVARSVDVKIYGGAGHGFMRPGGPQYNAQAAADAWNKITEFFASNLKRTAAK